MDELNPKSRVSVTALVSAWLAVAAAPCMVVAWKGGPSTLGMVALGALVLSLLLGILALIDIRRSESWFRGTNFAVKGFWILALFLLLGTFLPDVSHCGWGMRRAASMNNFKQIAVALQSYQESCGRFPPAIVSDQSGRPLYSWRVLILPYLDEARLYQRFHLDEPWDSPHNRALLPEMPFNYRMPHRRGDEQWKDMTVVQAFLGKGTAFESPQGEPLKRPDDSPNFPDGTAETLMAVEARTAVAWTRPIDLPFLENGQLPILGGTETPKAIFMGITADGYVHEFRQTIPEPILRALITRNGREPLRPEDY